MLLRRIRPPTEQQEKDRHQRGKRGNSGKKAPKSTGRRHLRRWRMRHSAKTRRTSQLPFLVCYAFPAERSSAMWTSRRRFTQWMKQTVSITQARRRAFVELRGWSVRNHSFVWHPRWERPRNLRRWFASASLPVGDLSREYLVARFQRGRCELPYRFS